MSPTTDPPPPSGPHVLLLVTDDQGAWALGSRMPELHTPVLDRLQREGMTFERFFCASPVCSPARASIATGRMPSAHGVHDWLHPDALARAGQPRDAATPAFLEQLDGADTIAGMLSRGGYRCGLAGKWHVGSSDRPAEGFEYWYAHQLGGGPYYDAPIWEQDPVTGVPHDPARAATEPRYLTEAITERALDFLRRGQDDPRPFFLQMTWTAPHDPWFDGNHPRELLDLYADTDFPSVPRPERHPWFPAGSFPRAGADRRGALAGYCAAISGVDRSIGAILDRLEETGQLEDTIVVFVADNGFSCGHHGYWGKGNGTWPLNFWEPSIRVPCIVRWPGHVPAGTVDRIPTSATSLLETIAELTGAPPIADRWRAGRSFASRALGLAGDEDAEPVVIHDEYGAHRMLRTEDWKLVVRRDGPTELYDLRADPEEERNLAADPDRADRVRGMTQELAAWYDAHTVPALDGWATDVDGSGQRGPLGSG
ncbi:sulfatase-like hydrolase/transferase [Brachybacterium hainanense]|uniref:Sulfatase-like hydrolase/transferase n=1 Tax=Brachybacterium hainanense TaxID=1541174 RepID=A0ABV6R7M0_9MICO